MSVPWGLCRGTGTWATEDPGESGDVERNGAMKMKTGCRAWTTTVKRVGHCSLWAWHPVSCWRQGLARLHPVPEGQCGQCWTSVQLKPCLSMSSKDSKQKLTQPTCWNMAGYHWLEWNFTPAEAYSSHDPIFRKINTNICLHPEHKLFKGDKARESKYKSFYRPGCQLTLCFVSSLANICSAERKTWVFLRNVCEWIGVLVLTLVCLSSANEIRVMNTPCWLRGHAKWQPSCSQCCPARSRARHAPMGTVCERIWGRWGCLSSHKESRCVCVCDSIENPTSCLAKEVSWLFMEPVILALTSLDKRNKEEK